MVHKQLRDFLFDGSRCHRGHALLVIRTFDDLSITTALWWLGPNLKSPINWTKLNSKSTMADFLSNLDDGFKVFCRAWYDVPNMCPKFHFSMLHTQWPLLIVCFQGVLWRQFVTANPVTHEIMCTATIDHCAQFGELPWALNINFLFDREHEPLLHQDLIKTQYFPDSFTQVLWLCRLHLRSV